MRKDNKMKNISTRSNRSLNRKETQKQGVGQVEIWKKIKQMCVHFEGTVQSVRITVHVMLVENQFCNHIYFCFIFLGDSAS